ncbi:MAG: OadG family protein [bacterium]|nr:OadG family protein [bacterium]
MMLEGLHLMAVGMFTVFGFLTLLVGLMKGSAAFFEANAHRFPEDEPAAGPQRSNPPKSDEEIALAIALAAAMRGGQRV